MYTITSQDFAIERSVNCPPEDWLCKAMTAIDFGLDVKDRIEDPRYRRTEIDRILAEARLKEAQAAAIGVTPVPAPTPLWVWVGGAAAIGLLVLLLASFRK